MFEWSEQDFLQERVALANRRERPHQRMCLRDLVVPVRTDEEQVLAFWLNENVFQELERRSVEPLEIVEKQRQRMLGAREHTDQPPEGAQHAGSRLSGWNFRNGRLL